MRARVGGSCQPGSRLFTTLYRFRTATCATTCHPSAVQVASSYGAKADAWPACGKHGFVTREITSTSSASSTPLLL